MKRMTTEARSLRAWAMVVAAVAAVPVLVLVRGGGGVEAQINHETCRPDGMARTAGVNTPYCQVYDTAGREKMPVPRRIIGYFTAWRHGQNGQPAYLVKDVPWSKLTHINYAFAHIDSANRISVGSTVDPRNPATGLEWPGVPGAEMDPQFPYKGHFNLLNKFKRQHPQVKTLVSVGGWAETGGYFDDNGVRVASGGFYTLTASQARINTFADSVVTFLRTYRFDGVDIDYEYATSNNDAGNPLDWSVANGRRAQLMAGYVNLMRTLRQKLDAAGAQDGRHYLVTVAAPASGWLLRGMNSYEVTQYLDYINIMTYDLHGAWNRFVGPNAALYDDGQDGELAAANVYGTYGMGYLNSDWAYHYFRGAVQAGRINIGVPFYTRGWKNVSGGNNGLWGSAPSTVCPTGLTACGDGGIGIDNVWHDEENGTEMPAGSNPMWHAKNLESNIQGTYLQAYGLNPGSDPSDRLTGLYTRNYNTTLVAPWLWNAQKRVFLSTEDEPSIKTKADYVVGKGIGGIMFWELAGDYAWYPARRGGLGEFFIGNTLVNALHAKFAGAAPYGNRRAARTMPTQVLDVKVELVTFPLGDFNYPINPKMRITNNSTVDIPPGAALAFDMGTSAPSSGIRNQSSWTTAVQSGHDGANVGGLRGDFHRVTLTMPTWMSAIPRGGTTELDFVYTLPAATPSNWTLSFGGQTYGLLQDQARGVPSPTPTPTPSATPTPSPTPTPTPSATPPACHPAWSRTTIYTLGNRVTHLGVNYEAKWWTQGEDPSLSGEWGVWRRLGPCGS